MSTMFRWRRAPVSSSSSSGNNTLTNEQVLQVVQQAADYSGKVDAHDLIISCTTIPPRLLQPSFRDILVRLLHEQLVRPRCLVLNVCQQYMRPFEFDKSAWEAKLQQLQQEFGERLVINRCPDYGPGTKLLGLAHCSELQDQLPRLRVVVVDDDFLYSPALTLFHVAAHQLFPNWDMVATDEQQVVSYPHLQMRTGPHTVQGATYNGFIYGWLSFSIRGWFVPPLLPFFHLCQQLHPKIVRHDDLLFTLFHATRRLFVVGLPLKLSSQIVRELDLSAPLRLLANEQSLRQEVSKQLLSALKVPFQEDLFRKQLVLRLPPLSPSEAYPLKQAFAKVLREIPGQPRSVVLLQTGVALLVDRQGWNALGVSFSSSPQHKASQQLAEEKATPFA